MSSVCCSPDTGIWTLWVPCGPQDVSRHPRTLVHQCPVCGGGPPVQYQRKASLWKLDLCTTTLPQMEKLLHTEYEITDILAAQPSVDVHTSQEERLYKYQLCFK